MKRILKQAQVLVVMALMITLGIGMQGCNKIDPFDAQYEGFGFFTDQEAVYWTNDSGTILFSSKGNLNSGTSYIAIYYNGVYYTGRMMMGDGYYGNDDDVSFDFHHWIYLDNEEFGGSLIIRKIHSMDEMTMSFETEQINIPDTRMHKTDVTTYEGEVYALEGFKGILNDNGANLQTEAKGVTADGKSRLLLTIDKNIEDAVEVTAFLGYKDCEAMTLDEKNEFGRLEVPRQLPGQDVWYMEYTAPINYNDREVINVTVLAKFQDKKGNATFKIYQTPINIYKMGVGLVHGLWSNAWDCFSGLKTYLVTDKNYLIRQVQLIDYQTTHDNTFRENTYDRAVIETNLEELYDYLLGEGIISSRYALVGHSMGGILSRLYAQDINAAGVGAIITLDTPHWGSQLATFGRKIIKKLEKKIAEVGGKNLYTAAIATAGVAAIEVAYNTAFGGLRDLATDSEAIKELNSESSIANLYNIPVHAVCSDMEGIGDIKFEIKGDNIAKYTTNGAEKALKVNVFLWTLSKEEYEELKSGVITGLNDFLNGFYGDSEHDGIVSGASQRGGLAENYCTIERAPYEGNFGFESNAFHCKTNKWDVTYANIGDLLKSPYNDSRFAMQGNGFKAPATNARSTSADEDDYSEYEYTFIENENTYIRFKTCTVEEMDDTKVVKVEVEKSENIIADMALVMLEDEEFNIDLCRDTYLLEIPKDYTGTAEVFLYGKTENQELVIEQETVTISK